MTNDQFQEIFLEIVGDPDDGAAQSHMWMLYMENINLGSTVKEAKAFCELMVENEDEENPGWRDEEEE
jgi:hypothetical protein